MTGLPDSAEEEAGISITVKKIDEEENVFQYNDVTGEVDLKDLKSETFISDFQKSLNRNSDSHDFRNMELIDSGTNFYEFKVSIMDRKTDEEIDSETETEDIKKTEEPKSESKEKAEKSSSASEKEQSKQSLS